MVDIAKNMVGSQATLQGFGGKMSEAALPLDALAPDLTIKIRTVVNKWISVNFPTTRKHISHTQPKRIGDGWEVFLLAKKINGEILGSLQITENLAIIENQQTGVISRKLNNMLENIAPPKAVPDDITGDLHRFIYGDGIQVAAGLDDRSVDLLLTDPPYGISNPYTCEKQVSRRLRKNGTDFIMPKGHFGDWDYRFNPSDWTDVVLPKVSGWAVIFCAQAQIGVYSDILNAQGFNSVGTFVWQKTNPVPFNHKFKPINAWESIVLGKRPGTKFNGRVVHNVIKCKSPSPQERIHPTQKPLPLIEKFVELFSNEGDLIFDPFAGSATTLIAANTLNRKIIACENNEEYYRLAADRMKDI